METLQNNARIGLRVFKRSGGTLLLLWDKVPQADLSEVEITATRMAKIGEKGKSSATFVIDKDAYYLDRQNDIRDLAKDTSHIVVCVIREDKAKMDLDDAYYIKVRYAGKEQGQKILPSGILPDHEKDNSDRNVHGFGWSKKSGKWRKVSGVETDQGDFAMLVAITPCPSCGWEGEQQSS